MCVRDISKTISLKNSELFISGPQKGIVDMGKGEETQKCLLRRSVLNKEGSPILKPVLTVSMSTHVYCIFIKKYLQGCVNRIDSILILYLHN